MAVRDTARRKLAYDDYILWPEDGKRHEILDGEHYVTPAPSFGHQGISLNLSLRLGTFVRERGLGFLRYAPLDVILSAHDVVQPDLLFISNERRGILSEANVQGAPDLVIEILSESTRRRDETLKLARYEGAGVLECWLVDPKRRTVRIFRRSEAGFLAVRELSAAAGDLLASALFPGLEMPVSEIFSE
jgi:Uma2 family endonuclease